MSLAIFPSATSYTTAETDDTAMLDDAQVLPAGDMDMSPEREPMHSFTATASMEWGVPSQPQLPMGDLSMTTDGHLDTSMYGELGPVDMEMTAEYDMTMDDDIQHHNYEMYMTDAAPMALASIESAVPLVAGHVYSAGAVEATYPVSTPAVAVVAVDSGLAAPSVAPLHHTPATDVAQVPLYSPHDAVNPASVAITEFYAPAGPETEVAPEPASPPAADPPHGESVAAVAELLVPPEPETTVEHTVEPTDQVAAPFQPADHTDPADPAQEPEPDTAHVTEVAPQSDEYHQAEQEAPQAESVQPQEETYEANAITEHYPLEPPTLGIPPILLSILFSPASSPTHSPHLPLVQPLYSLFSKPDLSTLPSSSTQPGSLDVYLLLADRPQLFFENVATVLQALREELLELEGGEFRKDTFEFMEMILYARQLDLTLPEDNIHAQSISLYDFVVLHQSCAVPGYLHLDLKLQLRFKSRWDEIKRAVTEQEREYEAEAGYTEHEQAAPNEGQKVSTEQARSTTVNEEQAQDGTTTRAEDSHQPELTESASTLAVPHQTQQQQQPTDDQPSLDLSEFVGFVEPPLDDDDDNWDDDDDTVRVANTTADTHISLAHTEVPVQSNEGEEQAGQDQYTDSHQYPEGEYVSAEYGEYEEGEWGAEGGHEEEGAPVEQLEAPAAGHVVSQGQTGTIEAGDEVAQYDGEEYIGPEYEYVYNESEVGEWAGDAEQEQLNTVTGPEPNAIADYSQDVSTQQDHVSVQTTQDSTATATTTSLDHLPAPSLPQQQEHEQPEAEPQEPEEYYDFKDGDAQEYYGNYGEGGAEDGDGSPEHPIDLTAVDGGDEQQVRGDPSAYTRDQDVDEVSTLEGSPSQDDQAILPEVEAGGELVNDEDEGANPVLVDEQARVTVQRRASGHKRRREDVEAEENEDGYGSDVKRARLG